jgi:NAD-reducing hydrogenase small subunit
LHELWKVRFGVPYWGACRKGLRNVGNGKGYENYRSSISPSRTGAAMTNVLELSKARIATVWLDGCSGCHMSLLDVDELLLELSLRIELVYGPLMDAQAFPVNVDVSLVEGGISNEDDLALVRTLRANSKLVVALGDCAVTANVPSMRNTIAVSQLLERVYVQGANECRAIPRVEVPELRRHVVPLHDVILVDLHVPGCPPKASVIADVIRLLLDGKKPNLEGIAKFG